MRKPNTMCIDQNKIKKTMLSLIESYREVGDFIYLLEDLLDDFELEGKMVSVKNVLEENPDIFQKQRHEHTQKLLMLMLESIYHLRTLSSIKEIQGEYEALTRCSRQ